MTQQSPVPSAELHTTTNGVVGHAHPVSKKPQIPPSIVEAIRAEMKSLVEGDLDANLMLIEQLAARARELFMTFKAPHARFNHRSVPYDGMVYPSYGGSLTVGGVTAVAPQNVEQFGAKAIREIIALIPEFLNARAESQSSPEKLVEAISLAKKNGEDDVAKALIERLKNPSDVGSRIAERLSALVNPPKQLNASEGVEVVSDGDNLQEGIITVGDESMIGASS